MVASRRQVEIVKDERRIFLEIIKQKGQELSGKGGKACGEEGIDWAPESSERNEDGA